MNMNNMQYNRAMSSSLPGSIPISLYYTLNVIQDYFLNVL